MVAHPAPKQKVRITGHNLASPASEASFGGNLQLVDSALRVIVLEAKHLFEVLDSSKNSLETRLAKLYFSLIQILLS